ncbi:tetratricopeptide repeat protein [Sphingobacterium sp.]|uniref:tetratricopeptide repeat protein n=1 Tax=Sphingobacterium sp. TaxID=341027 RepID=UPI00289F9BF9|nr:tetratricopeptide repeat protein [Sphingobacterium sp.]
MIRKFKHAGLLIIFCGSLSYCQSLYAQRGETTIERNETAREINELYDQGKWEEGRRIAESLVKKNPKDADMRMLLGKYYLNRKQYDQARYELVKSLDYAPANVETKHLLVAVETETKRYSSAICYINELLEVNPYWKGLWRKKIELYRIMGNQVEADRLLKRISQIYPEDNELKMDQNYLLEKRTSELRKGGRITESIDLAKKMLEGQPNNPDHYYVVIDNYIKSGDYNNALIYAERALQHFPGNGGFVQKKIAVLDQQRRYAAILHFLDNEMKRGGSKSLQSQYNYFLLEAARDAKNSDPASLYGKIFHTSPGNKEAFHYVFDDLLHNDQYEGAIQALNRHRRNVGNSKELDMRELSVYKKMGNTAKIASLTESFFSKYPNDSDLKAAYVSVVAARAKSHRESGNSELAITDWREVLRYGDEEMVGIAQYGLFSTYVMQNRYQEAVMVLDDMLLDRPGNVDLLLKKSAMYHKMERYDYAINLYEQAINSSVSQDRKHLLIGYGELVGARIKQLRENYRLPEARVLTQQWLNLDSSNQMALLYMINICYQLKDKESMLSFAKLAEREYKEDLQFKIKLAEAMNLSSENLESSWSMLHAQVVQAPFHATLVTAFANTSEQYADRLLKNKEYEKARVVLDSALHYSDTSRVLKYMKGLAYEGLRQFDSAYVYQSFYEPSLLEYEAFKMHLSQLQHRTYRNSFALSHLRARFGDDYKITSISTAEFSRLVSKGSSYTGRVNYAGRDEGKGIQGQFEWFTALGKELYGRVDIALSNKFFAKYAINAAAIYAWKPMWEGEVGVGYRRFHTGQNLSNLNLAATKEINDFRLGLKLSNFYLDSDGERFYLYNLSSKIQYFMDSPRNYILAVASVGNSPDIDLVNNQLYNSFNMLNSMVGVGIGRGITKNVGVSALGTWYNFQKDETVVAKTYRNLYNLYFQIHVSF